MSCWLDAPSGFDPAKGRASPELNHLQIEMLLAYLIRLARTCGLSADRGEKQTLLIGSILRDNTITVLVSPEVEVPMVISSILSRNETGAFG